MILETFENEFGIVTLENEMYLWSVIYRDKLEYCRDRETAHLIFNAVVQRLKLQEIEDRVNRLYEMFKEQEKE